MNPQVEAALIAGIVSLISLGGTVVVALRGFHATTDATEKTVKAGHEDTRSTLAEQREQLDRTLGEQHVRTLNDRFATAADKLGIDKPAAVRLAGVYAMAKLADDWEDNRQTCIDVLCGYLRIPYAQGPGDGLGQLGFEADREVRHTVIRVITAHLGDSAKISWQGRDFDFTGVVFDGGDFSEARFSGGTVNFRGATFSGGTVYFSGAKFSSGTVNFSHATFSGGTVYFSGAKFSGGEVYFSGATFSGGTVEFTRAEFSGATVELGATFSRGTVSFGGAKFSEGGVCFSGARFSGGTVDFHEVAAWLHPPRFDWDADAAPPEGVMLPPESGGTLK